MCPVHEGAIYNFLLHRMTNSYTASLQTWEVDKEALFPPVGPTGSQQLHPSLLNCGGKKMSHKYLKLALAREMLPWAGHEQWTTRPMGRLLVTLANWTWHKNPWPGHNTTKRLWCICSVWAVTCIVRSKCARCAVALCVDWTCFTDCQTKNILLTLNLPMTTIVAQPFNVIKWQLKFNPVA